MNEHQEIAQVGDVATDPPPLAVKIRDLLESLRDHDPAAAHTLLNNQVPCAASLLDHPTIGVCVLSGRPVLGMLGVLNGLIIDTGYVIAYRLEHGPDSEPVLDGFEIRHIHPPGAPPSDPA